MRIKDVQIIVGIVLDMVMPKEIGIKVVFIHQSTKAQKNSYFLRGCGRECNSKQNRRERPNKY